MRKILSLLTLIAACCTLSAQEISIEHVSTYETGVFDEGAAEIVAYDPATYRLFSTNADLNTVDIIDIHDPMMPSLFSSIDISMYGGGVNSVDTKNGLVAVAVEAEVKQDPGLVVLFDTDGNYLNQFDAGALPDMVTFSPDGNKIVVANEGEPNDDYDNDPEGSITVIDISLGLNNANVSQLDFTAYNGQIDQLRADGVRIFGPNATVAQDLEPEYVSIAPDGNTAYVSLQENNALAIVDLQSNAIVAIRALGFKDHSNSANGFDASDKDDDIEIWPRPTLGMYQPDAIATYQIGGETYILTANEGDARDYDGYSEEVRVDDLVLDESFYPNPSRLQEEENLGRLKTTLATGDYDGDGEHEQIYSYGARSFSIWNASGEQVFDSGNQFAKIIERRQTDDFNNGGGRKKRSDDKGVEPEAVTTFEFDGSWYALIGLERQNGVMVYNIDNPEHPQYVNYFSNRNYEIEEEEPGAGDIGVEDIIFIAAADSPDGEAYVVTANEVSGTISLFKVMGQDRRFSLQILHNNDGESALVNAGQGLEDIGGVARFKTVIDSLHYNDGYLFGYPTITLSSGDNFLAGPEFNASLDLEPNEALYDALAINRIRYDAIALGNHDFDFGPDVLARLIEDVNDPATFLSANLNFQNEPALQSLVNANRIAPKKIIWRGKTKIGVIGLTTTELPFISSPRNVVVNENLVQIVQAQVNDLTQQGVDKIILISHLQGITEEIALAESVSGIDVIIAGGGDELLSNNPQDTLPGLDISGPYPMVVQDVSGKDVYLVTTPGEYRYVGNLVVTFNENGTITNIADNSGPVKVKTNRPDYTLTQTVVNPVQDYLDNLAANIIAVTEPELDGIKANLRTRETNQGNLVADALLWQANELAASFGVGTADVALQNGGGVRNNSLIAAGSEISELTTFNILPFSNFVTIVEPLSADHFKEVLENAVSRIESVSGRFAQISGFEMKVNADNAAQELDADGQVLVAGERIREVILDNGTVIVQNGTVVPNAPNVSIATIDFLARGGDAYPYRDASFTALGVTYQQALAGYLTESLNGLIANVDYPEGGTGRIQFVSSINSADPNSENAEEAVGSSLNQAYPNPFSSTLTIDLNIDVEGEAVVALTNAQGQLVKVIYKGFCEKGHYRLSDDQLDGLANGYYFLTIQTASKTETVVVVKG